MREGLFYQKLSDQKVRCSLCPHNCLITTGRRGLCGVRENRQGILYSLVYGRVVSTQVDPIEKKPLYHFFPGSKSFSLATVGCNLSCDFCQNWEISQCPRERGAIYGEETTAEKIVAAARQANCQSIAYTYTEPTIYYEFAADCARLAVDCGLKNVFVTNGFIDPAPLRQIAPFLSAANVDLKSFSDDFYKKHCGARLAPVLQALKLFKELGVWLEVTTLVIPGLNDSQEELKAIASFIREELGAEVPWHVSGFYPTYKLLDRPPTPSGSLLQARGIGLAAGLKHVYTGNRDLPEGEGTYCPRCQKLVIGRSGHAVVEQFMKQGACGNCGEKIAGVWG